MAQLPQSAVNRRVKTAQMRRVLKDQFNNEEGAVRIAEVTEKIMDEILKELRDEIKAGFAKTSTKSEIETLRELINKVSVQNEKLK